MNTKGIWLFSPTFSCGTLISVLESHFFGKHLDEDEAITLVVHKHWLLGVRTLVWPTAVFIGLWVLLYWVPDKYVFFGVAFTTMVTVVWWLRNFYDYYLDAWIITNKGIIDLEWHGWFHRQSARVLYSDIQGVEYEIKGIVGTLLNIGTIAVEKISTGTAISMQHVKRPRAVETAILEMLEAYMLKKNLKDSSTVKDILAEFVAGAMQTKDFEPKVQAAKAAKKKPPVKQ